MEHNMARRHKWLNMLHTLLLLAGMGLLMALLGFFLAGGSPTHPCCVRTP